MVRKAKIDHGKNKNTKYKNTEIIVSKILR